VAISRRALITGSAILGGAGGLGIWGLLADARLVPGRSVVDTLFGRCDIAGEPAEAEPGRVLRASFFSSRRRRTVRYLVAYPPNVAAGAPLPVCLFLHGTGGEAADLEEFGFHRILAAAVAGGVPPFVLAAVDGGDRYWHPRADGDDPLRMLLDDFPVVLAQHGLPVATMAVLGISMGGYGALLALSEAPARFAAVAATAPAFWFSYEDANDVNPGAFDSAEDWRTWGDLRPRTRHLADHAVRIDCGVSDPFEPNLSTLREQLPDPSVVTIAAGCHDAAFFRSVAPAQLKLIGEALTPPPPPPS
jgi:pimeloyl-ACP methyl ester carboxylesterase